MHHTGCHNPHSRISFQTQLIYPSTCLPPLYDTLTPAARNHVLIELLGNLIVDKLCQSCALPINTLKPLVPHPLLTCSISLNRKSITILFELMEWNETLSNKEEAFEDLRSEENKLWRKTLRGT